MGKKGKAPRKPKQRAEQQATARPGQNAFGESAERSAIQGQAARSDAFGETGQRSAQPGRAAQQPNRSQQQDGRRPAQQQDEV